MLLGLIWLSCIEKDKIAIHGQQQVKQDVAVYPLQGGPGERVQIDMQQLCLVQQHHGHGQPECLRRTWAMTPQKAQPLTMCRGQPTSSSWKMADTKNTVIMAGRRGTPRRSEG